MAIFNSYVKLPEGKLAKNKFSPFLRSSTPSTGADRGAAAVRSGVRFEGHQDAG